MNKHYTIDWKKCRSEINLTHFMEHAGFCNQKKRSEKADRMVKNGEVLIVNVYNKGNNEVEYLYFNPKNHLDKGDIINFIQNHLHVTDFKGINDELRPYIIQYTEVYEEEIANKKIEPLKEEIVNVNWNHFLDEITDYSYLIARGIAKETISSPFFINRVYQTGKDQNIAFPLFHNSKIKGIAIRNFITDTFGGKLNIKGSNHQETVWYSNFNHHQTVNRMIIGESPLDLISKYELNKELFDQENVVFVAVNGEFGIKKIEYISQIINYCDPHKIELSFDNDVAGYRFDVKMAGQIVYDKLGIQNDVYIDAFQTPKEGVLHINLCYENQIKGIEKVNYIKEEFNKLFNEGNFIVKSLENKSAKLEAQFLNKINYWKLAYLFAVNIRGIKEAYQRKGNNRTFKIDKSKSKDFNEDLMKKKSLSKSNIFHLTKGKFASKEYDLKQFIALHKYDSIDSIRREKFYQKTETQLKELFNQKVQYYQTQKNGQMEIEEYRTRLLTLGIKGIEN